MQVLVATMHQKDYTLLDKMNIQSNAIIGNQCDKNEIEEFDYNGHKIKWLSLKERGVGLNRNTTLMRADDDICLFADDDVRYVDNYSEIIMKTYEEQPKADIIIFNMQVSRDNGPLCNIVHKDGFVGRKGVSSFGAYCVSARTRSLKTKNIVFHRMFGGGTEYSCGEDSIFLQDCVRRGLKVYTCTKTIGTVMHGESTWFDGFNEKYFIDKGVLYNYLYPRISKLLSVYHVIKHRDMYAEFGLKKAICLMCKGTDLKL